jgi:hypothetical protein
MFEGVNEVEGGRGVGLANSGLLPLVSSFTIVYHDDDEP